MHFDHDYDPLNDVPSFQDRSYDQASFYKNATEKAQVERMLKAYMHNRERDNYRALTSFFGGHTRSQKFTAVNKLNQLLRGESCELTQTDVDCLKQGKLFRNIRGFSQLTGKVQDLKPGRYQPVTPAEPAAIAQRLGG